MPLRPFSHHIATIETDRFVLSKFISDFVQAVGATAGVGAGTSSFLGSAIGSTAGVGAAAMFRISRRDLLSI